MEWAKGGKLWRVNGAGEDIRVAAGISMFFAIVRETDGGGGGGQRAHVKWQNGMTGIHGVV